MSAEVALVLAEEREAPAVEPPAGGGPGGRRAAAALVTELPAARKPPPGAMERTDTAQGAVAAAERIVNKRVARSEKSTARDSHDRRGAYGRWAFWRASESLVRIPVRYMQCAGRGGSRASWPRMST